jgi:transcriptional regulator with XRE-family HTH domain
MSENPYTSVLLSNQAWSERIGAFVRHHRLAQNITQAHAAERSGMSRSTWGMLEKGEAVSLATLLQALRTLGVLDVLEGFELVPQVSPLALAREEALRRKRARGSWNAEESECDW